MDGPAASAPADAVSEQNSRPARGPGLLKRLLFRRLLPDLTWLLLLALRATWRVHETGREHFERACADGRAPVVGFLHGRSFLLLNTVRGRRSGRFLSMCSKSLDGDAMARLEERLGFVVVRGSSGRDGLQAVVDMIRTMRASPGLGACLAVDGSRGPRGRVQGGVISLAQRTGGVVVPVTASARPGLVVRKSWDRTLLAPPFARVDIVFGEPLEIPSRLRAAEFQSLCDQLEETLVALQATADTLSGFTDTEPVRSAPEPCSPRVDPAKPAPPSPR